MFTISRRPSGGSFSATIPFFLDSCQASGLSTRNLQYLSDHQFYTLCGGKKFVPTVSWPEMTSSGNFHATYGSTRIALPDSFLKFQSIL